MRSSLLVLLLTAAPAAAEPSAVAVPSASAGAAMLERLAGHRARITADRLIIDDVAGDGAPWVGVVERRGAQLWLVGDGFAVRLAGPLARPRLAGPGYTIWITGARTGDVVIARRLGVLARPVNAGLTEPAKRTGPAS